MSKAKIRVEEYKGKIVDQMPLMLSRDVAPLSVAEFMGNRKVIIKQLDDVHSSTSDLAAYGCKERGDEIKVILTVDNQGRITKNGRRALELISSSRGLASRDFPSGTFGGSSGVVLDDKIYDALNWPGVIPLSRRELEKYGINRNLTEVQVLNNPGWRVLLRHPDAVPAEFAYDKGFMGEVVGKTFAEMKRRYDRTDGMGIYPDEAKEFLSLGVMCIQMLGNGSVVDGSSFLDSSYSRLVGVAPKAQHALTGIARFFRI